MPVTRLRTPAGTPASIINSTSLVATTGASSEGLETTVFPATAAAAAIPPMIAHGKFQGEIQTPTPSGM